MQAKPSTADFGNLQSPFTNWNKRNENIFEVFFLCVCKYLIKIVYKYKKLIWSQL